MCEGGGSEISGLATQLWWAGGLETSGLATQIVWGVGAETFAVDAALEDGGTKIDYTSNAAYVYISV